MLPVVVEVPTPSNGENCFGWNPNNCVNSLVGIKKLIWRNDKGLWQNTLSGSFQPWQTLSLPIPIRNASILSSLISATNLQVCIVSGSYNFTTGVVTLSRPQILKYERELAKARAEIEALKRAVY